MGGFIRWVRRLLGLPPRWIDQTPEERRATADAWAARQRALLAEQAERYGVDPRDVLG